MKTLACFVIALLSSLQVAAEAARFEVSNAEITASPEDSRFSVQATLSPEKTESRWQLKASISRVSDRNKLGGDSIFADGFEIAGCAP